MPRTRLAELLGRLSLAFDITNDSPLGKAVRSVVLAVELGAMAGASKEELRDTYWVGLLGYLGCTGFAHDEGLMGAGDDRSVRSAMSMFSPDEPWGSTLGVIQRIAPDRSLGRRVRLVAGMFSDRTLMERFQRAMCDTSIRLAEISGAGPRILSALAQLCERWDGQGAPGRVHGEGLALPMRLQQIGHVVEIAHQRGGREAAVVLARRRGGRQFDPRFSQLLVKEQSALFDAIEDPRIFERFLRLEPEPVAWADEQRIDDVARALAIFADLKSPTFLGHSTGVAALALRAAEQLNLEAEATRTLLWAALLHDLGRLSVPNGVWTKAGSLDWSEWERVRLHSYYTERILSPILSLAPVAEIAAAAHERMDGSGYHQHRSGKSLALAARVLAAADMAFAMGEQRPHRAKLPQDAIARELVAGARAAQLDSQAVDAVLASIGSPERAASGATHGLSDRELDVSRLLARGKTNKEIGTLLGISPRTVQNHVSHIFDKLGVHSRAGAAIWLVEHLNPRVSDGANIASLQLCVWARATAAAAGSARACRSACRDSTDAAAGGAPASACCAPFPGDAARRASSTRSRSAGRGSARASSRRTGPASGLAPACAGACHRSSGSGHGSSSAERGSSGSGHGSARGASSGHGASGAGATSAGCGRAAGAGGLTARSYRAAIRVAASGNEPHGAKSEGERRHCAAPLKKSCHGYLRTWTGWGAARSRAATRAVLLYRRRPRNGPIGLAKRVSVRLGRDPAKLKSRHLSGRFDAFKSSEG